jgi:endothelin-converting enzyme/putative endopeptidase
MRKPCVLISLALFAGITVHAQPAPAAPSPVAAALDRSVNPCDDFYHYACGTWLKNNPIPSDQPSWGRFNELDEANKRVLRRVAERLSDPANQKSAGDQKTGDFYASCIDEPAIEALGLKPLAPYLDAIQALQSVSELPALAARLHRDGIWPLFTYGSGQDFKNAQEVIAQLDQGGLGLPERDYYLRTDDKSKELLAAYRQHIERVFVLAGHSAGEAHARMLAVLAIETALAQASLDVTARREPLNVYHRMTVAALQKLTPGFDWNVYLKLAGTPAITELNVAVPKFFEGTEALMKAQPLASWQAYLEWQVLQHSSPLLPKAFVDERFAFYGKTLTGQQQLRPRWRRCIGYTDEAIGEELGRAFVEETFGPAGKQRTLEMVRQLEVALETDIQALDWMTPKTKQQALVKLHAITNKIGYPDKWRDYSALRIVRGDALGNSARASAFELQRQLNKIGQPVDKLEWQMTPPTVNAYYDPQMNNINFPAGILQPPFYDNKMDDGVNYGAIGAVIGHELTHGFDDQGRQFDPAGNLRDWWAPEDEKEFKLRTDCLVKEYSSFEAVPGTKINGQLTLGENTADNGGLRIALMALKQALAQRTVPLIDGLTPAQRLFLGWGQVWCENASDEVQRLQANTNEHATAQHRVNGVVVNMPEFREAFGCKVGQPMAPAKSCRVW